MLNGLDLFSGIGGLTVALSQWVRPVTYCEADRYCQGVLLSRMRSVDIAYAPIHDDVRTLDGKLLPEIDIIYGGFPCQDISVAGLGAGLGGERSGLFFEITRLARELRPQFVFLENVPAITTRGLPDVCMAFTALGYDCRWTVVSAAEVGAPHLRERWFMLASDSDSVRHKPNGVEERESAPVAADDGEKEFVADAQGVGRRKRRTEPIASRRAQLSVQSSELADSSSKRLEGWFDASAAWSQLPLGSGSGSGEWPQGIPKPALRRGDHGLQNRVDRLRAMGNAVVPLQARTAFTRLLGIEAN